MKPTQSMRVEPSPEPLTRGGPRREPTDDAPSGGAGEVRARNVRNTRKGAHKGSGRQPKKAAKGVGAAPDGYKPPRGVTPAAARPRRPSLHREELLPLVDVGSRNFELLCRAVTTRAFEGLVVRSVLKRTTGVEQYGVDVEGFDRRQDPIVVVSAKCYKEICAWDFRPWIDDFLEHLDGHWAGKGVRHFVLAVAHECNDDPMNAAAKAMVLALEERDVEFHLWDARLLSNLVAKDPVLVDRYFGSHWVDAVSASIGRLNTASPPLPSASNRAEIANQLLSLASQLTTADGDHLDRLMTKRLETAVDAFRSGRPSELDAWIAEARADQDTWSQLSAATRARALRLSSMLLLQRDDRVGAVTALDDAEAIHPAPDASARALLIRSLAGPQDSLTLLVSPSTSQERELKAALLMEVGRAPEALAFLRTLEGEAVTPEVLRLRAIAHFELGDHVSALGDATSAHRRAPLQASTSFTLATVKLLNAFVPGVRGRFGDKPNPMNPALLLDTPASRNRLDDAIDDFDRLALATEDPLRSCAEAWKLAGLLLQSNRRDEASLLSEVLSRREVPDPVVVAWMINFGLLRHRGRIKRVFHRELREGRGDASMVVVLARLLAGSDHGERGAKLIRKHRGAFPDASTLLDAWAGVFGDPDVPPANAYAHAVRSLMAQGDLAPLAEYLASGGAGVEDMASGCELLAQRGAWPELDGLRDGLLSIGSPRAVELAATAALRTSDAVGCLSVLERGPAAIDVRSWPRPLVHLRIRANEMLGRHRPVVDDLLALREGEEDEGIDLRLIDAYRRAGALPELRREAEQALAGDRLQPGQALRVAQILRSHAPDVARRALARATDGGITGEVAGLVAILAAELGLPDLQARSIAALVSPDDAGSHVVKFNGVDEVLAYIEETARKYRDILGEWLGGRTTAALAMHSDPKTFAKLFLADPGERRDQFDEPFPMLLRSGGRKRAALNLVGDRPTLLLDASALLLAERLGMLAEVERAFEPRLAAAAVDTLLGLESELVAVDAQLVATCRRALQPEARIIEITDSVPPDAADLCRADDPRMLDPAVLARILHQAFRGGHVDRDRLEEVVSALGAAQPARGAVGDAVVSSNALLLLGRLRILEVASRGARLHMATGEAERCLRLLAREEHEDRMRARVSTLRARIADGLLAGTWTTIPEIPETGEEPHVPRPAHVECLNQVLGAVGRFPGSTFWVEDRWLSHHGLDGLVDVVDVIGVLHRRGTIGAHRRSELLEALVDLEYSFMPVDADGTHALLQAAPVAEGALVETPRLSACRAWYVRAVALARHADVSYLVDDRGAVQGEVRHALDLHGLARAVIQRIWASSSSDVDKAARSEWAWTCLRSGVAPGWNDDPDPARRRDHAGMATGLMLDLPLLNLLDPENRDSRDGAAFMDWFGRAQAIPMARADPASRDVAVRFVAASVSRVLDVEPRTEPAPPAVRDAAERLMAAGARRFIDMLPGDLGRRVAATPRVAELLKPHSVMVMTFGGDREVTVSSLGAAYAVALSSIDAGAPLELGDGTPAMLSVGGPTTKPPPATIEVAGDRFNLPPHVVALLHPDPLIRSAGLMASDHDTDPLRGVGGTRLSAVAASAVIEDRFEAFQRLMDGDWHATILQREAAIRGRSGVRPSDVVPPSPDVLLAYLRLPASWSAEGRQVAGAAASLVGEFGWTEAARRLGGSPIELPIEVERELGSHLMAQPMGEADVEGASLLSSCLRIRAMLAAGATRRDLDPEVEAQSKSLRASAKLFVALVRRGASATLEDDSWRGLDPTLLVITLWSHADVLSRVLISAGMDAGRLALWVGQRTAVDLAAFEARETMPEWAARLTFDLDEASLKASVVSTLLSYGGPDRFSEASQELLKAACGQVGIDGLSPPLEVIAPPPAGPEYVWPARDVVPAWVEAGWTSHTHPLATRDRAALVENVLELASAPQSRDVLPALLLATTHGFKDRAILLHALAVLDGLGIDATAEPESIDAHRALMARASVLAGLDDPGGMTSALAARGEACAAKWSDQTLRFTGSNQPPEIAFAILSAAAMAHALALPRPRADRMASYASSLATVVEAWPEARRAAIGCLDALTRGLDADTAGVVWPTLMRLRGVA